MDTNIRVYSRPFVILKNACGAFMFVIPTEAARQAVWRDLARSLGFHSLRECTLGMTKRFNHEGHKGHEECVHESVFVVFVFFVVLKRCLRRFLLCHPEQPP
jgi:hypothetical protein